MKEIKLSQGKIALVDNEDFEYLNQWKWHAVKDGRTFYARRYKMFKRTNDGVPRKAKVYLMHRVIMDIAESKGVICDHSDNNGLNNQKINLRICSLSENSQNARKKLNCSSQYKGVRWAKAQNKWVVGIVIDNKNIHLGYFTDEKEAAIAYNNAAIKHHTKFANLNII